VTDADIHRSSCGGWFLFVFIHRPKIYQR